MGRSYLASRSCEEPSSRMTDTVLRCHRSMGVASPTSLADTVVHAQANLDWWATWATAK